MRRILDNPWGTEPTTDGGIYISGAITGNPDFKRQFREAENSIRVWWDGQVINPADIDLEDRATWSDYMRVCIPLLMCCSKIYMLKGWEKSRGARWELRNAIEIGIDVEFEKDF